MGLSALASSNNATKGEAAKEAIGLLRELFALINNPSDAKKSLSDILSMSEGELKKIDLAKELIAKYPVLIADLKKKTDEANEIVALAEKAREELTAQQAAHQSKEIELAHREQAVILNEKRQKDVSVGHSKIQSSISSMESALELKETALRSYESLLDERKNSLTSLEEELKDKAKKLKAHAESF